MDVWLINAVLPTQSSVSLVPAQHAVNPSGADIPGVTDAFKKDTSKNKVNLGVGELARTDLHLRERYGEMKLIVLFPRSTASLRYRHMFLMRSWPSL